MVWYRKESRKAPMDFKSQGQFFLLFYLYTYSLPILVLYPSTPLFPISHHPIEDISEWIMSPLNHINFDGSEDNIRSRKYASKGKAGCGNDEVSSIYQKGKGERPGKSPTINQKSGSYFAFCCSRCSFYSSSQLTRVSINSIHEFCDP